jgi:hypothetical protein
MDNFGFKPVRTAGTHFLPTLPSSSPSGLRNLDGRTTGRMDGKEDRRTDGHHGYYYVGDIPVSCQPKTRFEPDKQALVI